MKRLLLPALILISFLPALHATIRYVTPNGAGLLDGTSWSNAYDSASLQFAIDESGAGDEVWVSAGMYRTTTGVDRAMSFNMKNGVTIYGSFAGGETTLSQRILTNGPTSILSAEIGLAGIADNSYHTISNTGLNNTAVIDGFIIRDANDNRPSSITDGLGGGIYNNGSGGGNTCNPVIRNCVIRNNQAVFGAGIFNSGYNGGISNPTILNCVIANNNALTGGGGIDNFGVLGNASPVITNCVIYNNTAVQRAGGMYCWGGTNGNANPVVLNTVFVNNSAVDGGGVVSDRLNASGIGSSGNSNPSFRNCIFRGNIATGTGPQFFILGGASFNATYSNINLTGQTSPHIIAGPGTGNIDADPLFTNIGTGAGLDGNWMTTDDGLQLTGFASPCYNTGNNTGVTSTDILSNTRIANGTADMGAYEFSSFALPVHLGDFFVNANEGKNYIRWTTITEKNNFLFEIERSADGIRFSKIGMRDGAINSDDVINYEFIDIQPHPGINYYRLKQIDMDGNIIYSRIISVENNANTNIVLFPNPTKGNLSLLGLQYAATNIKVINTAGIIVKRYSNNQGQFDITELPNGVYSILIETSNGTISKQVIKK